MLIDGFDPTFCVTVSTSQVVFKGFEPWVQLDDSYSGVSWNEDQ